jgi:glycosyltransferase involved in cell wall biosynthesis
MPAFHAGRTLAATWRELPHDLVDEVIVVDDSSHDDTVAVARSLGLDVILHPHNVGYGGNQKTCYTEALARGADIIVMVHPDYQYDPRMVTAMAGMIASGVYDLVLGSRILGGGALAGGMPLWKYAANRALTTFQNVLMRAHLSEYHTGYRAYSRAFLDCLPWQSNSDDYVFDNEILAQAIVGGFRIGEVSVPTRYHDDASSITFARSVRYGLGVVRTTLRASVARIARLRDPMFVRRDARVAALLSGHDGLSRQREELVAAAGRSAEQAERHAVDGRPERRGSVEPT